MEYNKQDVQNALDRLQNTTCTMRLVSCLEYASSVLGFKDICIFHNNHISNNKLKEKFIKDLKGLL